MTYTIEVAPCGACGRKHPRTAVLNRICTTCDVLWTSWDPHCWNCGNDTTTGEEQAPVNRADYRSRDAILLTDAVTPDSLPSPMRQARDARVSFLSEASHDD